MQFGEIISKAWRLTWRYRYLWVLGLFAGITGPGGGGGGSFNPGSSFPSRSGSSGSPSRSFNSDIQSFMTQAERLIPLLIAVVLIWIIFAIAWTVLRIAARGGLIWAVDAIEGGYAPRLGEAWKAGLSRFWSLFGLSLLLQLPVAALALLLVAAVAIPLFTALSRGGGFIAGAIAPVCGVLVIGIPLLIVLGFVLGIMELIAQQSIMLEGRRAIESASFAWGAFRHRFKDTALMWLITWGLNIAAGLVLAIPIVIVSLALLIPAVIAAMSKEWGVMIGFGSIWLLILIVVSLAFDAIWGTFTSALWTIFYRRLVGREVINIPAREQHGTVMPTYAPVPQQPGYPPESPPFGPPMAPIPGPQQAPDA